MLEGKFFEIQMILPVSIVSQQYPCSHYSGNNFFILSLRGSLAALAGLIWCLKINL